MKRMRVPRAFYSLRVRLTGLLLAGVLLAGIGFELLLVGLTHHWLFQEMDFRTRSLAAQIADRSETSLLVGDRVELNREIHRAAGESDVAGVALCSPDGNVLVSSGSELLAPDVQMPLDLSELPAAGRLRRHRLHGETFLEAVVPIRRSRHHASALTEQATQLFGLPEAQPPESSAPLGWVRLTISTARAEEAVRTAAQLGLVILLLVLLALTLAVAAVARVIVKPLREASGLAREIAAGQLDRRLPVRSDDELGGLARSMNTMAEALDEAEATAQREADALRSATAAVVAIARGARTAHDPASVFGVVAAEVQRVTGCHGVALAIPVNAGVLPRFAHFEPAAPWGGLAEGATVDPAWLERLGEPPAQSACFVPSEEPGAQAAALAADGFRTALVVPLQLPGGPPAILLLASRDVGGFTVSEADLVTALAGHLSAALHASQLNAKLEQTFEELQRTHEYLVQSEMLRVAGEMATGVAHEFNNVLGAILGRAQLLLRRANAGKLSAGELVVSLEVIERAARDGKETGRRLRQFGRAEGSVTSEAVDLGAVLHDAVEFTRTRWENEAQAGGRSISITIEAATGAWVEGRGHELREVFTNLILNAVDALPNGGSIRLSVSVRDGRVVAHIEDDGVGMSEETRRRIFEPFFTTKGELGTGLGMSVVYGIVQRHGGEIAVESRPGDGTRLELSFPLDLAPTGLPILPPLDETPTPALDVMIVDDDPAVRSVLHDVTESLGHRVRSFDSGAAALDDFAPGRYQLVMTDLGMPGMTGWELARHLRERDESVTIAFVTGWGENVSHDQALDVGADLVIAKPFTIEDVERLTRLAASRPARAA
jgi:signal transduction histidine kinase/ActR/RegA family two-component response regulator